MPRSLNRQHAATGLPGYNAPRRLVVAYPVSPPAGDTSNPLRPNVKDRS